jgi:hypothetical protein
MPNSHKGVQTPHGHSHRSHAGHGEPSRNLHHNHNARHHRRQRRHRRRKRMGTVVFAATALFAPHHGRAPKPNVTTTVSYSLKPTSLSADMTGHSDTSPYEPIIQEAASKHRLDPALIRAVMRFESGFQPTAVSRAGARGLMQLMPEVATRFGVRDVFDPRENIMAGAQYLRELLDLHQGKVDLALASYNAGPGAVARYHAVPPYPETRRYVRAITGFIRRSREATEKP